jgi:hypothetical protein
MSRIWKRLLAVVVAVPAIGALHASPALAGDAGRNCKTYYYHANPATGWGFTVCVKLVHDPGAHTWLTTGSVTTGTPGMVLHSAKARLDLTQNGKTNSYESGLIGPAATRILDINTGPQRCPGTGIATLLGKVSEQVTWPSGELSSPTATATIGDRGVEGGPYSATC